MMSRGQIERREDSQRVESEQMVSEAVETEQYGRIACPVCGFPIGAVRGSKSAICGNCGFKDGCC